VEPKGGLEPPTYRLRIRSLPLTWSRSPPADISGRLGDMSFSTYTHLVPKPLAWLHGEVKTPPFSRAARLEAGELLRRLQEGESLGLPHSRPMPDIGPGCHELRVADEKTAHRLFYAVRPDAIVILGVVTKKSRTTPGSILKSCSARLRRFEEV
jgi:phage-related protein